MYITCVTPKLLAQRKKAEKQENGKWSARSRQPRDFIFLPSLVQLLHKRTEEEKLFSRSFRPKNQEKKKTARGLAHAKLEVLKPYCWRKFVPRWFHRVNTYFLRYETPGRFRCYPGFPNMVCRLWLWFTCHVSRWLAHGEANSQISFCIDVLYISGS